jgi:hypothetical protein
MELRLITNLHLSNHVYFSVLSGGGCWFPQDWFRKVMTIVLTKEHNAKAISKAPFILCNVG